jgi:hypothetical protein
MRARAFTVFSRAYDQVRRAAMFLRWNEGDPDAIVPSLYAGRGGRGKAAEEKPVGTTGTEVADTAPSAPEATPGSEAPANPTKAALAMPNSQPFLEE